MRGAVFREKKVVRNGSVEEFGTLVPSRGSHPILTLAVSLLAMTTYDRVQLIETSFNFSRVYS